MTRMYKQQERRAKSPRRPSPPSKKTGSKKDNLPKGFLEHTNAFEGTPLAETFFIPKI